MQQNRQPRNSGQYGDLESISSKFSQKNKIVLKIVSERGTKRIKDTPENFESLVNLILNQILKIQSDIIPKERNFRVQYEDDSGDLIVVSDDDDLHAAYDWAESQQDKNLKFKILPNEAIPQKSSLIDDSMKKDTDHNPKSFFENLVQEEEKQVSSESNSQPQQDKDESESEDSAEEKNQTSSDSNTDEKIEAKVEQLQIDGSKPRKNRKKSKKGKKIGKSPKKFEKQIWKEQKKAIKKMIKDSLNEQSKELIQSIVEEQEKNMGSQEIEENAGQIQENQPQQVESTVTHLNVECDGCGIAPITGPRYKCSICKNFDFCENCEQNKSHPHAFLKIKNPSQVPKVMFTVIDESMPNAQADFEKNANDNQDFQEFFRNAQNLQTQGGHRDFNSNHRHNRRHHHHGYKRFNRVQDPFVAFQGQGVRLNQAEGNPYLPTQAPQDSNPQHQPVIGNFDPNLIRQQVNDAVKNIFTQLNEQVRNGFQNAAQNFQNQPNFQSNYKKNRGLILSKTEKVLFGNPGDILFAEVEFKNNTQHPMKNGINLISNYSNAARQILEEVNLRQDFVEAQGTFKFQIPLKIQKNAVPNSLSNIEFYEADFELRNWKDRVLGEKVTLRLKVIEKVDEIEFYSKVMEIIEGEENSSQNFNFEDAVQALKEASYDVQKAVQILKAQKEQAKEIPQNQ